jgi:hypothetical protein
MTEAKRPDLGSATFARWEDDGGAPDAFASALPEGITSHVVREYFVGSYRYTDLDLAIAERDRQRTMEKDERK